MSEGYEGATVIDFPVERVRSPWRRGLGTIAVCAVLIAIGAVGIPIVGFFLAAPTFTMGLATGVSSVVALGALVYTLGALLAYLKSRPQKQTNNVVKFRKQA